MSGVTRPSFKESGIYPADRDLLIALVIGGTRASEHCFIKGVDKGSNDHEVFFDAFMIFSTSSSVTGENLPRIDEHDSDETELEFEVSAASRLALTFFTLSLKKVENSSQTSSQRSCGGRMGPC